MTPTTCDEVRALLEMDDVDARVDRDRLRAHLEACPECATRWPDAAWLVGARPAATTVPRRRSSARRVAAVAAAAVLLGIAGRLGTADRPTPRPPPTAAALPSPSPDGDEDAAGSVRWLPASASLVSHSRIRMERGRTHRSTVLRQVRPAPGAGLR